MNAVDVNVLVALFISTHPHHDRARSWWSAVQAAGTAFVVPDLVWAGFIRLVTDRRVFTTPRTFEEAWSFLEAVHQVDRYRPSPGGEPVLRELRQLAAATPVQANLVPDAYIAAVAVSLGAAVVTFDRDFRKFDGVRVIEPA